MSEDRNQQVVHISKHALMTLILSALEAYSVENLSKHVSSKDTPQKTQQEFYGVLFGTQNSTESADHYMVEFISVDLSAKSENSTVITNPDALALKLSIMGNYWPEYGYLGWVHSHPYETQKEVMESEGFFLSDTDKKFCDCFDDVVLLVTMCRLGRRVNNSPDYFRNSNNAIQFDVSNIRIVLSAFAVDKEYDDDGNITSFSLDDSPEHVILDCPHLLGMVWQHGEVQRFHLNEKHEIALR